MYKKELGMSEFYVDDKEKKDRYIGEIETAIQKYIKTGKTTKQLDELLKHEDEFLKKYRKKFDYSAISKNISEIQKESTEEIEKSVNSILSHRINTNMTDSLIKEVSVECVNRVMEQVLSNISENLQKVIDDCAYMSHMNMLFEMYQKEYELRREEEEFRKISEEFKMLADIAKMLSEQRRMKLEELEKNINLSPKDLSVLVNGCSKYFNFKENKKEINVSLSPTGRKFYEYVLNNEKIYSSKVVNEIVYKNCSSIIDSIEKSVEINSIADLNLEEVGPGEKRSLTYRYYQAVADILSERNETYLNYNMYFKGRKNNEGNEKRIEKRIKIPEQW